MLACGSIMISFSIIYILEQYKLANLDRSIFWRDYHIDFVKYLVAKKL